MENEIVVAITRLNIGPNPKREKMKESKGSSKTKSIIHVSKDVDKYSISVFFKLLFFISLLNSEKYFNFGSINPPNNLIANLE